MDKNQKHSMFKRNPVYEKNIMKFKLLASLPSFQTDIKEIRKELDICEEGLTDVDFKDWYEEKIIKQSDIMLKSDEYLDLKNKAKKMKLKNYSEYLKISWKANNLIPINKFRNKQEMLGEKYNLPKNFYSTGPTSGIWLYITQNKICAPSNNWAIAPNPEARLGTAKSMSLTTYAPLDKKELGNAVKMLKEMQKSYFPKQVVFPQRIKNNFERDLEIFKELCIQRKNKPVKKKIYIKGGYLSYVKNVSKKEMRSLERKNKSGIKVDFDEITSRNVARKFKVSSNVVRSAIKRMKELVKSLFDIDIEDVR